MSLPQIHGLPPEHIQQATDVLSGRRELAKCGRPTRTGRPCGLTVARLMPSCWPHSTLEERDAEAVERARLTALVADWQASLAPACHSWPVTDDDRRAVANLPDGPDELTAARHVHGLIWRWQQGRCAVCGGGSPQIEPGRWDSTGFVLDHDHPTALVRGWLCCSCNVSEPHSDRGDFRKYRDRPPATMLGVRARYEHFIYGLVEPDTLGG